MYRRLLLAVILLLSVPTIAPLRASDWKIIWSDEFNTPGRPDPAKWDYEEGMVRNGEAQFYTRDRAENAKVEGGMLVITGRKESFPFGDDKPSDNRTSASLTTEGKASWTYGRIEVHAKLPQGKGTWPAIWTLGTNVREEGWLKCGEIDIMEFVGKDPRVIFSTLHFSQDGQYGHDQGHVPITTASADFHMYAAEWWSDRIDFFLDGRKFHTSPVEAGQGDAFHKPHYLILNLALGGSWGGPTIDDAALSQSFLIDYVRVFQQDPKKP